LRATSRPRVVIGLLLWGALLAFAGHAILSDEGAARDPASRVLVFAGERRLQIEVAFPAETDVEIGDPVLVHDPDRYLVQSGHVMNVVTRRDAVVATLTIYPERRDLLREGLRVEVFSVPKSAAWITRTLLPPQRLEKIRLLAVEYLAKHGEKIRSILWPEIRLGLIDVMTHLERALPAALAAQSEQWEGFFLGHREGVLKERLVPVLQEVTLALARKKFDPLIEQVGEELWRALPKWSLGARYVWQKVPFTNRDQVRQRFDEFLKSDAAPILTSHAEEAGRLAGDVIRESLANPKVREALTTVLRTISNDPRLGALAKELLEDLVVGDGNLAEVIRGRWENGLKDAVTGAAASLEPLIQDAVNSVILDETKKGISPRLSRVVRSRVLMKDGRWVLLTGGSGARLARGARVAGTVADD
jgi:hypothetical protein